MNSEQPVKDEINIVKYTDPNYKETVAGGDPGAHIPKLVRLLYYTPPAMVQAGTPGMELRNYSLIPFCSIW